MFRVVLGVALGLLIASGPLLGQDTISWSKTKRLADRLIHADDANEFYCGCPYKSNRTASGSGRILSFKACGYRRPVAHRNRARVLEWEHVVPASLMPARQFRCWTEGGRQECERSNPRAQAMIFDLHNLVPAVGQVNALRGDKRYSQLPDVAVGQFGMCAVKQSSEGFEPADCKKGDVARVWLYMRERHGVEIPDAELAMFERWSKFDPVSRWESRRERRVAAHTRVNNPFVRGVKPSRRGACPWEKKTALIAPRSPSPAATAGQA